MTQHRQLPHSPTLLSGSPSGAPAPPPSARDASVSEHLPPPRPEQLPDLDRDSTWVRDVPSGTLLARIFRAGGSHPANWHEFRRYGPVDARFDPHPTPPALHPEHGVMYVALEPTGPAGAKKLAGAAGALGSAFAACLLEVFQQQRIIRRTAGLPTLAAFEPLRTLRLLDLSDSDWVSVAGGTSAITSGPRNTAREWARVIHERYPELDGVVSASSMIPSARLATLWGRAESAVPARPIALLRLDRPELTGIIDRIADRYGYDVAD